MTSSGRMNDHIQLAISNMEKNQDMIITRTQTTKILRYLLFEREDTKSRITQKETSQGNCFVVHICGSGPIILQNKIRHMTRRQSGKVIDEYKPYMEQYVSIDRIAQKILAKYVH